MGKKLAYVGSVNAAAAVITSFLFSPSASAFSRTMAEGADSARGVDQVADLFGATGIFTTVTNVLLFIVGAISVIMIVIGGLRYVISGGNSTHVTAAKNTILYAIVGMLVAILAYAMIDFVIANFTPGSTGGGTNV